MTSRKISEWFTILQRETFELDCMNISIIGCGYVGTVTGAGLAELGFSITFVDIDEYKVNQLKLFNSPVFEPGIDKLLKNNADKITATIYFQDAIEKSDISFICVGTPSKADGTIDLSYIQSAAQEIGRSLREKDEYHLIVVKSTVIPGTTEEIIIPLIELNSEKKLNDDFSVVMNPEFLREGSAVYDFFHPDRIVIGINDKRSAEIMKHLYKKFSCPFIMTNLKTAEMIKYVNNSFLATKISFANEIGNLCKKMGIDSYKVFEGIGLDNRINPAFFRSGIGFGGSCFPKDVKALIAKATEYDEPVRILRSVIEVNENQPEKAIHLLKRKLPILHKKQIGILGLAFKPDTDDIRESRAIPLIRMLLQEGASIIAYDPMAMDAMKTFFPDITYAETAINVLDSDAIIIVTEWEEFENLNYTGKIVIDGRRIKKAQQEARIYEGFCW